MADSLTLRVITPEKVLVEASASYVQFPGLDGLTGVLKGHAPLVSALDSGLLTWKGEKGQQQMFVAGGFCEVRDNTVRVVTEAGEPLSEIDLVRADKAAERARERLRGVRVDFDQAEFDLVRAQAALRRALMRQNAARRRPS
ncbi:MAG: ATP synthase F1 subunit epsilon [Planctomycetes bacterium]|nr:ATP synthase F1 subunit epsilon [Planctomycetota bacterium]MCB9910674.1 ATP synthase F1 subunit epsilon [Planctomycetota bacterium]HPF14973.1 ATP synthase F1 subunit epsilon [Planctomycetota bacterium]